MIRATEVLVINDKGQVLLPRRGDSITVEIGPGRFGRKLTAAIRNRWGLKTFLIVRPPTVIPVLRLQEHETVGLHPELAWQCLDTALALLPAASHADMRRTVLAQAIDTRFGTYRWYDKAMKQVRDRLRESDDSLVRVEQWHGDREAVVLRLDTARGVVYWLKAADGRSQQESDVLTVLASQYPTVFPKVFAHWPDSKMMLIEHLDGNELDESRDVAEWNRTARLLAELQVSSLEKTASLLTAGAPNLSPKYLGNLARPFCRLMAEVMSRQRDTPPARLASEQLQFLADAIEDACEEAASLPFASALANADFSPHNVMLTDRGPKFFDWAETIVGFPLVTAEYFLSRMQTERRERGTWQAQLEAAYRRVWEEAFGGDLVETGFLIARLLAPFTVAVYLSGWQFQGEPAIDDRYLRALTRRMLRHAPEGVERWRIVNA